MTAPSIGSRRTMVLGVAPLVLLLIVVLAWRFAPASTEITDPATDYWQGEYFAFYPQQGMDPRLGTTPQTRPAMIREDANIDFDWGRDSPDPSIPVDRFSIRWTRVAHFTKGGYRFNVRSDDGFRLYIDDILQLDHWFDSRNLSQSVDVKVSEGKHKLKVEYYENWGNALVSMGWEPIPDDAVTSAGTALPAVAVASISPKASNPVQTEEEQQPVATIVSAKTLPAIQPPVDSPPKPRPTGNQIVNGSFEQDANSDSIPDAWTVSIHDSEFGLATGQADVPEGNRVAIFRPSLKSFTVTQEVAASQHENYQFTGRVNIPSSGGWFRLSITLIPLNDQGQPLATLDQAIHSQPTSGWVEMSNKVTTPTYTSKLRVQIKADVMRATAYVDDLQLQLATP